MTADGARGLDGDEADGATTRGARRLGSCAGLLVVIVVTGAALAATIALAIAVAAVVVRRALG